MPPRRPKKAKKPELSYEKKDELTRKLLLSTRVPQELPKGFDPLRASAKELNSFGLPPRPKDPKQAASWERLVSTSTKLVRPTFQVVQRKRARAPRSREVKQSASDDDSASAGAEIWASDNDDGGDSDDYSFNWITSDWVVPDPCPDINSDSNEFFSSAYIGVDSSQSLLGGTEQDVSYSTDTQKWVKDVYAWYEWLPGDRIKIDNFDISPGDTVTCSVWTTTDGDGNITNGNCYFANWNTMSYTTVTFDPPDDLDFDGDLAQWTLEAGPIPSIGILPFTDCWAYTDSDHYDLEDARSISATSGRWTLKAVIESDEVLIIYET